MRFCCVGAEYTHVHTIMGTHTQTHAHTHTGVERPFASVGCAFSETYRKRDLLWRQKRPIHTQKPVLKGLSTPLEAKETYYGGKRDLLWRQKRPTTNLR